MDPLERLRHLPAWPARMTAPIAAAYMSVSPGTFTRLYREHGRQIGGKVFWAKVQLDQIIARQFDIVLDEGSPATATMNAYDRYKAGEFG